MLVLILCSFSFDAVCGVRIGEARHPGPSCDFDDAEGLDWLVEGDSSKQGEAAHPGPCLNCFTFDDPCADLEAPSNEFLDDLSP